MRPYSEKMNQLFGFMGIDRFVERGAKPSFTDEEEDLIKTLQERKERSVWFAKKTAVMLEDGKGRLFMFVPSSIYASDVATALLPKKGKTKYAMFVDFGRYEISLRSRDSNFDVSKIASKRGGGGHPGAAGFPIKGNEKFVRKYFRKYMEERSEMIK
jgi:nanoRNase/pAp phosphatase (c-di-AMP/oligoRNAs hydrolase)